MAVKTKTIAPTGADLSEAVGLALKQHVGPTNAKILQQKVAKAHPNWKLPERRVNKFMQRHLNKSLNPAGADDDQTATSGSSPPRNRLVNRLFGKKSPTRTRPESAPTPPVTPPSKPQEAPVKETIEPFLLPVKEEKGVTKIITGDYIDDNDKSEKENCECAFCVIM